MTFRGLTRSSLVVLTAGFHSFTGDLADFVRNFTGELFVLNIYSRHVENPVDLLFQNLVVLQPCKLHFICVFLWINRTKGGIGGSAD